MPPFSSRAARLAAGPSRRAGPARPASHLTRIALMTAVLVALSFVPLPLPLGPVPPTMQSLGVMMAGLLLPPGEAVAAVALQLALGLAGLPVLGGGMGGPTLLFSPAGAYLWGHLPGVAVAARLAGRGKPGAPVHPLRSAALALLAVAPGWLVEVAAVRAWLLPSWKEAVLFGLAGLLPLDVVKAALAVAPARALRKAMGVRRQA